MKGCINESYCINCRGEHKPNDKNREAYNKKTEIFSTEVRERVTYYEASEKARKRYAQEGKSYSEAVRHQSQSNVQRQPHNSAGNRDSKQSNALITEYCREIC